MNQAILLESNADNIDFMIHGIFSIKVFGQEVWITTSHACILIVMAIMVIFAIVANRKLKKAKEVPDGFQNIIELIVEMLDKMVEGTMGKWAPRFVNYISTIFIFILMSNISGLFGLRPPTADYGTTLALALITFFMIRFNKAKHQSAKDIWTGMCSPLPPWLPIWAQSTLSVRLQFLSHYHCVCSPMCCQNCYHGAGIWSAKVYSHSVAVSTACIL